MRKLAFVFGFTVATALATVTLYAPAASVPTPTLDDPPSSKFPWQNQAALVKVIDGDTADFMVDLGWSLTLNTRVRLWGLNTKEIRGGTAEDRASAEKAKKRFAELLGSSPVSLACLSHRDDFGRALCLVFASQYPLSVNKILLLEGHAVPFMRSLP